MSPTRHRAEEQSGDTTAFIGSDLSLYLIVSLYLTVCSLTSHSHHSDCITVSAGLTGMLYDSVFLISVDCELIAVGRSVGVTT